jgi:CheY-like chemotaxis protein
MTRPEARPAVILMVEDDEGDVRLTREALRDCKVSNVLHVVYDGESALAFLRREPPYGDAPRPDLVLLDLNLPRMNGHEVLAEIRADPRLHTIPVTVLTTSSSDEDVLRSYELHANAYVTKPVGLDEFLHVVREIEDFWFQIVRIPENPRP